MYLLFRLECFVYKKKNTPPDLKGMRNASTKHSATLACSCVLYIPFHPSMCTLEPL